MASITKNIRLPITNRETNKTFLDWRLGVDGPGDSAFQKLDKAWGDLRDKVNAVKTLVGKPAAAATAAAMTDTSKVYVYTGSEPGYTSGNWYYYDGGAWVSGGVYQATAIEMDDTLSVAGAAADAAAAGRALQNRVASVEVADNMLLVYMGDDDEPAEFQIATDTYEGLHMEYDEETYLLHLYDKDNVEIGDPVKIVGGGGGGGGSGNNAVMTLQKGSDSQWASKTVSSGSDCYVTLEWSSLENDMPTGNGILSVRVNNVIKRTMDVPQGEVTVNLKDCLSSGTNKVRISIADTYENTKSVNYTVKEVELRLQSNFDAGRLFTSGTDINYTYTPYGSVDKTVRFLIDGTLIGTQLVTVSGRQQSYVIPGLTHGSHDLTVYFDGVIDGETVESNRLSYQLVVVNSDSYEPIISSDYKDTTATQYETIQIPYRVYTPNSLTSAVELYADGVKISDVTVDRTEHIWSYRFDEIGEVTLSIVSGTARLDFAITVEESDIDASAETEDLALYLSSAGRSNNEPNPGVWEDKANGISAVMTGFNFVSDGWVRDSDGNTVLRVAGDARVTIPYMPFRDDFRVTGKTIEIEFASRSVLDYDAVLISCWSGDRGFKLTAQKALMQSSSLQISTQYKEDEHVRISFVVEKSNENCLIMIYINGIMSGVIQYIGSSEDFSQLNPVNITIGSSLCTTDIYNIRIYDNDLTRYQIVDNWIADTQNITEMVARYERNNIYNDNKDNIDINRLPTDLPYMVLEADALPQYKGNKLTCDGYYVDPVDSSKSFSFEGATIDVQGTSSQYYPRKNYKIKFGGGFRMTESGQTVSKYAMRAGAVPVKTFTFKADVASSEGANNVELARLYNDACPYRTPAQEENGSIRQGIDGFPIVMFWDDGQDVGFLGKYNFNNDKGTNEVFGFADDDESWEIKNNTSDRVIWKSNDYTGVEWLNDFESRYPELDPAYPEDADIPYTDAAQLRDFATWLMSTDPDTATGDPLPSPVTYTETVYPDEDIDVGQVVTTTYTHDTAEYRLSKFKAEAEDYMEMDSALFYYLFTELFLMVDSRAKNAFPSFMGTEVNA